MMYLWAMQLTGIKVSRLTRLSKLRVNLALLELGKICSNKILNFGMKLGGVGKIMEIYRGVQVQLQKRKYQGEQVSEGPWVFRGIKQRSLKVMLFVFPTVQEKHSCTV